MSTYDTQIPGAGGYAQAEALAQRAYANAMARLTQQRGQTMLRYGVHRDAGGQVVADADNELGQYQQMLRSEGNAGDSLRRAQAASGWGSGSGYLGAQADTLGHAQAGEQAQFGEQLQGDLSSLDAQQQQAAYDRDAALWEAQQAADQQAVGNQQFDPGDYTGLDKQLGYGDQTPVPPKPKGAPGRKVVHLPRRPVMTQHQQARAKLIKRRAAVRARAGRRR